MLLKMLRVVGRLTSRRERVLCCGSDVSSPSRPWLRPTQGVLPGSPVHCSWLHHPLSFAVGSPSR